MRVIDLPRQSEEFFLLHRIQDEVHRLPSPSIVKSVVRIVSVLNLMAWRVRPKRKQKLLKHFKSMTAIQKASAEDIQALGIPEKVAELC